jgi:hypothetical protein
MKPITTHTDLPANVTAVTVSWRVANHAWQSSIDYLDKALHFCS